MVFSHARLNYLKLFNSVYLWFGHCSADKTLRLHESVKSNICVAD